MNKVWLAAILSIISLNGLAQNTFIEDMLSKMGDEMIVILRQDYQLIDEDDNIKNAENKDYWKRTYSLAMRVGDDLFMISDEAVKPWGKEAFSKNSKFKPAISSTAVRPLGAIEFDEIDFDEDELDEIQGNRIYAFSGSELPGASVVSPLGHLDVYIVTAECATPLSEADESTKFITNVRCMPLNFSNKFIYDLKAELPESTFGGFAFVPVVIRPGLIDFCTIGMLQKVGGIWKLITVSEDTLIHQSDLDVSYGLEAHFVNLIKEADNSMQSFLKSIGFHN